MNLLVTQGALTTIYAGTHPTDIKGGAYYTDCTAGTVVSLPSILYSTLWGHHLCIPNKKAG